MEAAFLPLLRGEDAGTMATALEQRLADYQTEARAGQDKIRDMITRAEGIVTGGEAWRTMEPSLRHINYRN